MPNVIEPKIKEQKLFKCEREIRKNNLFFEKNSITFNFEKKFLFSYKNIPAERKKGKRKKSKSNKRGKYHLFSFTRSFILEMDRSTPHTSPPAHTRRNDGESTRDEQSKKRTNGAVTGELGANFPLDLKGSQVESRFSKLLEIQNERIRRRLLA